MMAQGDGDTAPASGAFNPLIPGEIQQNGGGKEDGIAPRYT